MKHFTDTFWNTCVCNHPLGFVPIVKDDSVKLVRPLLRKVECLECFLMASFELEWRK